MRHFSTHDLHQEGKNSFNRPSLERQKKNNPLKMTKFLNPLPQTNTYLFPDIIL